ncbi:MAG: RHS repeat-associated core domain-containing protein [Pirellulales bacterium]
MARQRLVLHKGRKDRLVPIGARALAWTEKYRHDVRPRLQVREDEQTFFLTRLGDSFSGSSMSILVKDYLRLAELDKAGACHLLRHAMATGMHDNGADVRWIQSIFPWGKITWLRPARAAIIKPVRSLIFGKSPLPDIARVRAGAARPPLRFKRRAGPLPRITKSRSRIACLANAFTYTGRQLDSESGIYQYRYRYYHAHLGRFVARDPTGYADGYSLYMAYFSPNSTDPHGLAGVGTAIEELMAANGGCARFKVDEFLTWWSQISGTQPSEEQMKQIYRGCIGLCAQCQACIRAEGPYSNHPEDAPNTLCYLELDQAKLRKCKPGESAFVFAKQGQWKGSKPPKPGPEGEVPNDSIVSNPDGTFNYVSLVGKHFFWMNNCKYDKFGNYTTDPNVPETTDPELQQVITICTDPCVDDHYPDEIWCSTCRCVGN